MKIRLLAMCLLISTIWGAYGQPMVGYFLSPQPEISKWGQYRSIEETSEVLIKGLASAPHRVTKEFNSMGLITSCISFNSAGGKTSEVYWNYENGGKLVRKHHRYFQNMRGWSDEEIKICWNQDYSSPTKVEVFKNGNIWQWATISSDTLGRVESAMVFNSSGALIFTERLVYLEASNIIRVMVFRANGIFSTSSSYPINPYRPFTLETIARQYYPNGNIMIETLTDAVQGDQAYLYEYEYDSNGNWIEKRTYQINLGRNNKIKNKKIENRVTRKISYQ